MPDPRETERALWALREADIAIQRLNGHVGLECWKELFETGQILKREFERIKAGATRAQTQEGEGR